MAKSPQLPYDTSIHHSMSPLDLIFRMFGGPMPLIARDSNTTLVLLMVLTNLLGFILCMTNLKHLIYSCSYKHM